MYLDYSILILTFTASVVILGYAERAVNSGWPIGTFLASPTSIMPFVSILNILLVLGVSFYKYNWWSPLVVTVLGIVVSFIVTVSLRWHVQIFGLFGMLLGFVATIWVLGN